MSNIVSKIFIDHPASVDESYFQHMAFAFKFSMRLFACAGAALVHAIIPCFFEKTASKAICQMHERMENR